MSRGDFTRPALSQVDLGVHDALTVAAGDSRDDAPQTVATAIDAAVKATGWSNRELARRMSGPAATTREIENLRRQIIRWRNGENAPDDANAARLADALGQPAGAFVSTAESRARGLAAISQAVGHLQGLVDQVDDLMARAAEQGTATPVSVERRLQALEAVVAEQGKQMTRALRALAKEVRALSLEQADTARSTTRDRAG